jgi:hypothetical protein
MVGVGVEGNGGGGGCEGRDEDLDGFPIPLNQSP